MGLSWVTKAPPIVWWTFCTCQAIFLKTRSFYSFQITHKITIWGWWFLEWLVHPSILHGKSTITHPIFIIKMQGIWIFKSDLYFHGILFAPLWSCYGVMSNAISHVLMFHTPTTPYNICNYFTICTHKYYIKPYILSHIIPTFSLFLLFFLPMLRSSINGDLSTIMTMLRNVFKATPFQTHMF